jgi:4-hydroxy-tetrahydrodipicolinate synthase
MSVRDQLRGTGVALITPFKANSEIDYDALGKLTDRLIADGVEYLVVLGTTGEAPTLSKEEKKELVEYIYSYVNARVPVVIGIGGNSTSEVIKEIERLPTDKATAILSASPYYNKPSQEGLFQHYKAIASVTNKPVILYNVPGRTGRNVSAETTIRLANEVENIAGIKEASGDMIQCMHIIRNKPQEFAVISGDDHLVLPQIACGMTGVISVAANCFAKDFSNMVRSCLSGDYTTARRIHYGLLPAYDLLFEEGSPAGVKAILAEQGFIENILRLPLTPLSAAVHGKIKQYLNGAQ